MFRKLIFALFPSFDPPRGNCAPNLQAQRRDRASMHAAEEQLRTFLSLPAELLTLVAEKLDACYLARFAAVCTVCLESAHAELRAALGEAVQHCLAPGAGPIRPKMIDCPYFRLPEDLTTMKEGAFRGLTSLTKLALPTTLTSIGDHAFEGCASLISITLPASLTSIGDGAFYGTSLTKITLPAGLTRIGYGSFAGCLQLAEIEFTLPSALQTIGDGAFEDCISLTALTVHAPVKTIGDGSFAGCGVTSLTLPATLTSIGDSAFARCVCCTGLEPQSGTPHRRSAILTRLSRALNRPPSPNSTSRPPSSPSAAALFSVASPCARSPSPPRSP